MKRLFLFAFFGTLILSIPVLVGLVWGYHYISRDLPRLDTIRDYRPAATSQVYSEDGVLLGEFFNEDGRRYVAQLSEIPTVLRNAFIASEDASFYEHPGVDLVSIARAAIRNFSAGSTRQGGSTITQQVVKNLVLTSEKKITRKIKEAILSYRLEQRLSKDDILEIYLNEIFLGNRAYGVKAATRAYFHKELGEISLAEAALLAGLPQAPSKYSPHRNFDRAKARQKYVLAQMVKAGFISQSQADEAYAEELKVYRASGQSYFHAPFYLTEVRRVLESRWRDLRPELEGLKITAAVDLQANELAQSAVIKGLGEVDKRQGWRGVIGTIPDGNLALFHEEYPFDSEEPLIAGQLYSAMITGKGGEGELTVDLKGQKGVLKIAQAGWAKKFRSSDDKTRACDPYRELKVGDVVEVSLLQQEQKEGAAGSASSKLLLALDQTPKLESALVMIDPLDGKVRALVGGYNYHRNQFNRVTQALRQPGSAFKPVVYLAAVDGFGYTPATIVYDTPRVFRVGEQEWQPGNFDREFLGNITLQTALQKSRNLVSADIISRIGIDAAIQYARKLGIESNLGQNLSLSLGSSEVTPLELTRAYGVFPAGGMLNKSVFITKIEDRDGNLIYDFETERAANGQRAISEQSAFVMSFMMKGVVERGTATRVKALGRPSAGKTGTSNNHMDAWYIGFTPRWVTGVWVGYDEKRPIGYKETGGGVAAPIWLYFMKEFVDLEDGRSARRKELGLPEPLVTQPPVEAIPVADASQAAASVTSQPETQQPAEGAETPAAEGEAAEGSKEQIKVEVAPNDFVPPSGVVPVWVNSATGNRVEPGTPGALLQYFIAGTEPQLGTTGDESQSYLETVEL